MSENNLQDNDDKVENLCESALNDLLCTIPRYSLSCEYGKYCNLIEESDTNGDWIKTDDVIFALRKLVEDNNINVRWLYDAENELGMLRAKIERMYELVDDKLLFVDGGVWSYKGDIRKIIDGA